MNNAPIAARRHPLTIAILTALLLAISAPAAALAADYTVGYGYDDAYQLRSASYGNITTSVDYVYDNMGNRTAKSTVGSAGLINNPPNPFNLLAPADNAADVSPMNFSWEDTGDPDGDAVTYYVYFDTGEGMRQIWSGRETSFDSGYLMPGTSYSWRVFAVDEHGAAAQSAIWSFTTEDAGSKAVEYSWKDVWEGRVGCANGLVMDPGGNLYAAGWLAMGANNGGRNIVIAKYTPSGKQLWVRDYNSDHNKDEEALAVAMDSQGNIILAGYTQGALHGQPKKGNGDRVFVAKYDGNGDNIWAVVKDDTTTNDCAYSIAVDKYDDIYVAAVGSNEFMTIKFSKDGSELWTAQEIMPSYSNADEIKYGDGAAVAVDDDLNVYAAMSRQYKFGHLEAHSCGSPPTTCYRTVYDYITEYVIIKYSGQEDGMPSIEETHKSEGPLNASPSLGNNFVERIRLDGSGSLYLTGMATFEIGNGANTFGAKRFYVAKFYRNLARTWYGRYANSSRGNDIAIDGRGDVVVAGNDFGNYPRVLLMKYHAADGSAPVWTSIWENNTKANGIVIGPDDGSYICGEKDNKFMVARLTTSDLIPRISSPADGDLLENNDIIIEGDVLSHNGATVGKVQVSLDSGVTWLDANDTSGDNSWSTWGYQWTPPVNGGYTVMARAVDDAGNAEYPGPEVTFSVGVEKLASAITGPADGAVIRGGGNVVSGTASDKTGSGVEVVRVSLDDEATWDNATDESALGGWSSWSYSFSSTDHPDGNLSIMSRATDITGYVQDPPDSIEVLIDNTPPDSTITAPVDGEVIAGGSSYGITGTASDAGSGLDYVEISINGGTWQTADGTTDWTFEWNIAEAGNYTIVSRAVDLAGNVQTSDTSITVHASWLPYEAKWTSMNGTTANDFALDSVQDACGNTYVTGYTNGVFPGGDPNNPNVHIGNDDVFLAKYDKYGNLVWGRQVGTGNEDVAEGVAVDGNGNVYVTGFVYNAAFPSGDGTTNTKHDDYDVFVAKFDSAGNFIWGRQVGSSKHDKARDVAVDTSGGIYITGHTNGLFPSGDPNNPNVAKNYSDVFLAKYDPDGNFIWGRQTGNGNYDYGYGVATDSTGNIYITGSSNSNMPDNTNVGGYDAILVKYQPDGNLDWIRQFGTSSLDEGLDVALDSGGSIYVTGDTIGAMESGDPLNPNANAGAEDLFVAKYDDQGNVVWTRQTGTSAIDIAEGVAVDMSGNIFLTGTTKGDLEGSTGNSGTEDAFAVMFDPDGALLWTKQFGTSSAADMARSVSADTDGNICVAGYTNGVLENNSNLGSNDIFVTKLVKPDATKPHSSITAPSNGAILTGVNYEITGTSTDGLGSGVQSVEISINGGAWQEAVPTGTDCSHSSWSYGWTLPADGTYTLQSRSTDKFGNIETTGAGITVTVDNVAPVSSITDPIDGAALSGESYIITGTAVDGAGSGVAQVEVSTDGGSTWDFASYSLGIWSYNWTPLPADDSYNIKSRATDFAGNIETPGEGITAMLDKIPPASSISVPPDGAIINGTIFTITGASQDGSISGVYEVDISTDEGQTWNQAGDTSGFGNWSSWSYGWTLPADGEYTISSRAVDNAGNLEDPGTSITVTVDNTAPVSSITGPSDSEIIVGSSYTITGTADDSTGPGVVQVEVSANGGSTWDFANYSSGTWSYDWSPLPADDSYDIVSRATDYAGNVETPGAGVTVIVDNDAPFSSISSIDCSTNTIYGTAGDDGSGVKEVYVSIDSAHVIWELATGTDSWSYNAFWPDEGDYTIQTRAVDVLDRIEDPAPGTSVTVSQHLVFQSGETTAAGGTGSGIVQFPSMGLLAMSAVHQYDETGLTYDSGQHYDVPTGASGSWTTAEYDLGLVREVSVVTDMIMTSNLSTALQIRYKSNIGDSWSNWETLTPDLRTFRYFQIKADVTSSDTSSKGQISKFEISAYAYSCN